jgi:transcriptional regulator with XRE-family HTH domain
MQENESTNNPTFVAEIGARFQALRVKSGLSLNTLVEQVQISAGDYLRLEKGTHTPTAAQFRALLGCFGVRVDAFVETLSPQAARCARELLGPDPGSAAPAFEETALEASDNKPAKLVWGKSTDNTPSHLDIRRCIADGFKRFPAPEGKKGTKRANEIVYGWDSSRNFQVRIYTGVDRRTGTTRTPGSNGAARPTYARLVIEDKLSKTIVGPWSRFILLSERDWDTELMAAQGFALVLAAHRPQCKCGNVMQVEEGKGGSLAWRCAGAQKCKCRLRIRRRESLSLLPYSRKKPTVPALSPTSVKVA